jgi:O-antigen ligase
VAPAGRPSDSPASIEGSPPGEGPLVGIGFVIFLILLLSGMVNDWANLLFGGKGYISAVMVVVTPAVWLASGNSLRGFRDRIGIAWLLLLAFMLTSVPFSVWKGNSVVQILNYVSRSLCFFFYIAAFTTNLKRCRALMMTNIAVGIMILVSCVKFGYSDMSVDGRFQIPRSMFVGNSNDLALQLTIAMTEFLFLFYLRGIGKRLIGLAGILLSLFYMLKTGSRGSVLALAVAVVATFILSKQRMKMALAAIPLLIVAVVFIPQSSSQRLLLMFRSSSTPVASDSEASALASQSQREELIKKSVTLTLQHPVFGVGMGQFVVAVMGEAAKKGEWAAALGTHNSYTQVSSECGILALVCYVAVICFCFQRSYRLYQLAAGQPKFRQIEGLAFSLLIGTLVYAVATFFFHIAYSGLLPMLSGEVMALYTIAYPALTSAPLVRR